MSLIKLRRVSEAIAGVGEKPTLSAVEVYSVLRISGGSMSPLKLDEADYKSAFFSLQ